MEGTALPSTNGRGLKINLSKAKVRFSGEGSDLSDSVKSLVSTAEQTAGLPRSQGYLLPRNDMRKKAAFTLAEVLITLGIIGVVAAMTLPTLISNYQKRVYVTQLKKSVSVLSQGFTTMMGHDGVTELKDTHAFSGMGGGVCNSSNGDEYNILTNNCSSIREGLQNVFSGIQFVPCDETQIKELNGSKHSETKSGTCIEFPDGSEIFSLGFQKNPINHTHPTGGFISEIYIDINGSKNPNTWGRDVFWLVIANNGTVYGTGSQPGAELHGLPVYWRTTTDAFFKCNTEADVVGMGCAGRVLEEDAMNY